MIEKAMAKGVKTCLGTVHASLDMIVQAMTDTYEADQEIRPRAAVAVLQYVVYKICERDINQRLRASGHRTVSAATFMKFEATPAQIGSRVERSGYGSAPRQALM
jgi:hypothetical protein